MAWNFALACGSSGFLSGCCAQSTAFAFVNVPRAISRRGLQTYQLTREQVIRALDLGLRGCVRHAERFVIPRLRWASAARAGCRRSARCVWKVRSGAGAQQSANRAPSLQRVRSRAAERMSSSSAGRVAASSSRFSTTHSRRSLFQRLPSRALMTASGVLAIPLREARQASAPPAGSASTRPQTACALTVQSARRR